MGKRALVARFKIIRRLILLLFTFYVVSSQFLLVALNTNEVFPFARWALFSQVDGNKKFFEVYIDEFNGAPIPSCKVQDCFFTNKRLRSNLFFRNLQRHGFKLENNTLKHNMLSFLEESIRKPFSYTLKSKYLNPIEYAKNGTVIKVEEIYRERIE